MYFDGSDLAFYAPDACVNDADAAVLQAQLEAEGPNGANRKLEKQEFTEILKVTSISLQTLRLTNWPVDLAAATTIEVRTGNIRNALGRPIGLSGWTTLEVEDYQLDLDGKLSLNVGVNNFAGIGLGYQTRRRRVSTEVRATYTAGFDFTTTDNSEVEQIKHALGRVVAYQASSSFQGISELDFKDDMRIKYQGSLSAGMTPDSLLLPFRRYRSRGF